MGCWLTHSRPPSLIYFTSGIFSLDCSFIAKSYLFSQSSNLDRPLRLVIFTESAEGLLDLREILSRLQKLSCCADKHGAAYVLEGIVNGYSFLNTLLWNVNLDRQVPRDFFELQCVIRRPYLFLLFHVVRRGVWVRRLLRLHRRHPNE